MVGNHVVLILHQTSLTFRLRICSVCTCGVIVKHHSFIAKGVITYKMAKFDLTSKIGQYLDRHLVFPLLEFLSAKEVCF